MRLAFATTLAELAEQDSRILLLTGDLGYMVLDCFSERFPERFFNMGVAEQNMVGVATGLAEAGFVPFLYSIATFASLRAYEFIRNGPIHHQLPVRIIGVGGGFEYGHAGSSHYGLEDVGVMRLQPGLTLVAPADHEQARSALLETWDLPGPVYYRLSKDDKVTIPGLEGRFRTGRAQTIREGADLLIISMGSISSEVARAASVLADEGINSTVMIVASLNPAPVADLSEALKRFAVALTVEAHYTVGGVGSLVAEVIAEHDLNCRLVRCGVKTSPDALVGSRDYLQHAHGLSSEALVESALRALQICEATR